MGAIYRARDTKPGREVRTPAMQAGLFRQRLTFREIFLWALICLVSRKVIFVFLQATISGAAGNDGIPLAAYQQRMAESPTGTRTRHREESVEICTLI